MRFLLAILLLLVPGIRADAHAGPDGAALYKRCAACHLSDGAGVPGAFPPLAGRIDAFAATEQGRAYLVMVISKGLAGRIDVNGATYQGVMPAQAGLTDDNVAELLNFLLAFDNNNVTAAPFEAREVAEIRASNADLDMRSVLSLRPESVAHRESTP
ncbi:MAG: cytochrome c [Alphaproteobacteria bacterium]|nr:MAG: cytochrome c [Alphaproteobacteria bacterium]